MNKLKDIVIRSRSYLENIFIGSPDYSLFFNDGLGDNILLSSVAREIKKRNDLVKVSIFTNYHELFYLNKDIHSTWTPRFNIFERRKYCGYRCITPYYCQYDASLDYDIYQSNEHLITSMCRIAGVSGTVELKPNITLTPEEKSQGFLRKRQVVIQSSGKANPPGVMLNKNWLPERFQGVVDVLKSDYEFIQLGNIQDPLLQGVIDLRGKTKLRQSAAILSQSCVFVGQVGFLMHMARAVDCRSVIIYGGREDPAVSGYECNVNIRGITSCSPCWQRNRCDHDRECMRIIDVTQVVDAVLLQLERCGQPFKSQLSMVKPDTFE